jgi:hypothetical protein
MAPPIPAAASVFAPTVARPAVEVAPAGNGPHEVAPAVIAVAPVAATAVAVPSTAPIIVPGRAQSLPREADRAQQRWAAEEKEHRRLRRNIITATVGIILLLLLSLILMKIAG